MKKIEKLQKAKAKVNAEFDKKIGKLEAKEVKKANKAKEKRSKKEVVKATPKSF